MYNNELHFAYWKKQGIEKEENASMIKAKVQIIAHRGFWKYEGCAQNSLCSLRAAGEHHFYGSEFDVRMSRDNVLLVHHSNWLGFLGPLISHTSWNRIQKYQLRNNEEIPLLEDYLKAAKRYEDLVLFLEIKQHPTLWRTKAYVRSVVELVNRLELSSRIYYISLSKYIVSALSRLNLKSPIAYVKGDVSPYKARALGATAIDYPYLQLLNNAEWIEQAHKIGMTVNCWTVNRKSDMEEMIHLGVDYITTDEPLVLEEVLSGITDISQRDNN